MSPRWIRYDSTLQFSGVWIFKHYTETPCITLLQLSTDRLLWNEYRSFPKWLHCITTTIHLVRIHLIQFYICYLLMDCIDYKKCLWNNIVLVLTFNSFSALSFWASHLKRSIFFFITSSQYYLIIIDAIYITYFNTQRQIKNINCQRKLNSKLMSSDTLFPGIYERSKVDFPLSVFLKFYEVSTSLNEGYTIEKGFVCMFLLAIRFQYHFGFFLCVPSYKNNVFILKISAFYDPT